MFKRYRFTWGDAKGHDHVLDFFVDSVKTRSGFKHRACAIGPVPRIDDSGDWNQYRENELKLHDKRYCQVCYENRTWESWPGQKCLSDLWDNLSAIKFVNMSAVRATNPFEGSGEPNGEDMPDADELFGRFRRRRNGR